MACLCIVDGPATGQIFALENHELLLLGRDDSCSFQILDERVSRRHLKVRFDSEENRHYALDCGSANGVLVNGTRISEPVALNEGDAIRVGNTTIVYSVANLDDAQSVREAWVKRGQSQQSTLLPPKD